MTTNPAVRWPAPAKINLALHVTGQRSDGYHLLDSLVMFTELGDIITVTPADSLSLTIDGPFAKDLPVGDDNLVLRAARLFGENKGAAIALTKNLPLASGIGGGSADAAATLYALSTFWSVPLPDWNTIMSLGADVGVCMSTEMTRMSGIGEDVQLIGPTPPLHILLVNPGVPLSTPAVFNALPEKSNAAMGDPMPDAYVMDDWLTWLSRQRNDLQGPATTLAQEVSEVLKLLAVQNGCHLARMSGSGATCFALFENAGTCEAAKDAVTETHPNWWVQATIQALT